MALDEIINQLREIGKGAEIKLTGIECYLFGSILKTKKFNDVDILIIYKYRYQINLFNNLFERFFETIPLHIVFFTSQEESEFNFINGQHALKIFSI